MVAVENWRELEHLPSSTVEYIEDLEWYDGPIAFIGKCKDEYFYFIFCDVDEDEYRIYNGYKITKEIYAQILLTDNTDGEYDYYDKLEVLFQENNITSTVYTIDRVGS